MNQSHFQTIIVGVDFSGYSKTVVKQATLLAKEQGAELVFVHAQNIISGELPYTYSDLEDEFIKPLTAKVHSFYKIKDLAPNSKVIIKIGRANDSLISVAKDF